MARIKHGDNYRIVVRISKDSNRAEYDVIRRIDDKEEAYATAKDIVNDFVDVLFGKKDFGQTVLEDESFSVKRLSRRTGT